jgi:hypothetical protein
MLVFWIGLIWIQFGDIGRLTYELFHNDCVRPQNPGHCLSGLCSGARWSLKTFYRVSVIPITFLVSFQSHLRIHSLLLSGSSSSIFVGSQLISLCHRDGSSIPDRTKVWNRNLRIFYSAVLSLWPSSKNKARIGIWPAVELLVPKFFSV